MKFKEPKNENYSATIARIDSIVPAENLDFLVYAVIMGQKVLVPNTYSVGDTVVFFPLECQLDKEFLSNNNLYRKPELNLDPEAKGLFEDNGRVRAVRLKQNPSKGFSMPLKSLEYTGVLASDFNAGDTFDEINGHPICQKYFKKTKGVSGTGKASRKQKKLKKVGILDGQFNFHYDTSQLYRNLHRFDNIQDKQVSITKKLHGTSVVVSKVLCERQLSWFEKLLMKLGVKVQETEYKNIYSSRRVIKNDTIKTKEDQSFYKTDIWGQANERLLPFLTDGMTIYAEIVGYLDTGCMIQKDFDYGCKKGDSAIYIYRITLTTASGFVPELYYGNMPYATGTEAIEEWTEQYLDKQETMCKSKKLPTEGVVIRIEDEDASNNTFKLKSQTFYELETKNLDKEVEDIEEDN